MDRWSRDGVQENEDDYEDTHTSTARNTPSHNPQPMSNDEQQAVSPELQSNYGQNTSEQQESLWGSPLRPCLPMLQKIHNQKMGRMQPIAWPFADFLEFEFVKWMVNHDISQGSRDKLIKLPIVSERSMHQLRRLTYNVRH
jgi:hypothetical protein